MFLKSDILNDPPLGECHLIWVADMHAPEVQFDRTILPINYPLNNALRLIRKNIVQELKDEYHGIAREKNEGLFHKNHPFLTFEHLPDGNVEK